MRTLAATVVLSLLAAVAGLCGLATAAAVVLPGPRATGGPTGADVATIPGRLTAVYRDAAGRYCDGLAWEVLAGIGWVESRHGGGAFDPDTGEMTRHIFGPPLDGNGDTLALRDPSSVDGWVHAEGPLQFLPSTWRRWATLAPGRPSGPDPSPHNIWDAIHTAARMLCGSGAQLSDVRRAVFGYNHDWGYVDTVLAKADEYREAGSRSGPSPSPGATHAGA